MNFNPTKYIPLPLGFPNGTLFVQRTSARVGVSASKIGVGTLIFNTCATSGDWSIKSNIPPLLMFSESACPVWVDEGEDFGGLVISYSISLRRAARSLWLFWESAIGHSHAVCPTSRLLCCKKYLAQSHVGSRSSIRVPRHAMARKTEPNNQGLPLNMFHTIGWGRNRDNTEDVGLVPPKCGCWLSLKWLTPPKGLGSISTLKSHFFSSVMAWKHGGSFSIVLLPTSKALLQPWVIPRPP